MSFFDSVPLAPSDPVFGLAATYLADPRPNKINLIMGVYKNPILDTPVLKIVKKAELEIIAEEKNKEYFGIEGDKHFLGLVGPLIFGKTWWHAHSKRVASCQGVGGTGALRLGGDLLRSHTSSELYYSEPTWVNHHQMMAQAGFKVGRYPYYDFKTHQLAFDKMVAFLKQLPPKSVILLHACCHNPSGADLSLAQWHILSDLFFEKQLIPFFDFAYQGFGQGIEEDAIAIRLFAEKGHTLLVANSFSKNFGLYGERVGGLFVVTGSEKEAACVLSQLKTYARTSYSNPPIHGAKIVRHILGNPILEKEWEEELRMMRGRVDAMKEALTKGLTSRAKSRDFNYLRERQGLFCYCGLTKQEAERLIVDYAIYMTAEGRINVAGLNPDNLDYVVDAIVRVSEL